jgi:hypothetical protein
MLEVIISAIVAIAVLVVFALIMFALVERRIVDVLAGAEKLKDEIVSALDNAAHTQYELARLDQELERLKDLLQIRTYYDKGGEAEIYEQTTSTTL